MRGIVNVDRLEEIIDDGNPDDIGICLECGSESYGIDADAEEEECHSCGCWTVYGIEQLKEMVGI